MSIRQNHSPIRAKTANFTIDPNATPCGGVFTNAGAAGAVIFTLPQLQNNLEQDGYWLEFQGVADQTFTVACTAGKAITFNNAAATSLACSTGGQKIGGVIRARWDASQQKWHLTGKAVGVTYTVA